jgi:hypothetical protein
MQWLLHKGGVTSSNIILKSQEETKVLAVAEADLPRVIHTRGQVPNNLL